MKLLRMIFVLSITSCLAPAALQAEDEPPVPRGPLPEWMLLHKVEPVYPPLAIEYRIQGIVRFTAIIGEDGRIEELRLVFGHPLLVPSARAAVHRWIYRPTLIGGRPVRVVTQIDVPFRLGGAARPPERNQQPERKT